MLRRSLAAPLSIPTGGAAHPPAASRRRAPNLAALIAPLQSMAESFGGQSPERKAELRAERRAKASARAEARRQAQAEKAARQAARQAERQAGKDAQKQQDAEAKRAAKLASKAERAAQRKQKTVTAASPVTAFGTPPALPESDALAQPPGSPDAPGGSLGPGLVEDPGFDTSPFQLEPLPERAWSKAHDLYAEPDIPFEDPLVPTNVAPLPSEVPPPAPPPLDPIFQSLAPGVNPDDPQASSSEGASDAPPPLLRPKR